MIPDYLSCCLAFHCNWYQQGILWLCVWYIRSAGTEDEPGMDRKRGKSHTVGHRRKEDGVIMMNK
jgi:hypothetical protein